MRLLLVALAASQIACFLPLSSGAPQSARTVGKGGFGVTAYAEFPSVNLLASTSQEEPISPALTGVAQGAYGIAENLDLELGLEGNLYLFFLPLPTGASAGVRAQLLDGDIDLSLAGRGGYSGITFKNSEGQGYMRVFYGMASATAQLASLEVFRPGVALTAYPAWVSFGLNDQRGSFPAVTSSLQVNLTLDVGPVEITPFGGVVVLWRREAGGLRGFPQGGLALALRPQKEPPPAAP